MMIIAFPVVVDADGVDDKDGWGINEWDAGEFDLDEPEITKKLQINYN